MLSLWTAFKSSKLMGYLIVAFAAIGAVVIVLARAFGAGRAAEKAAAQGQIIKDVETRHEIDRAVAGDPDPADSLRKRWSRD
jgi:hypothetical protein